MKYVVVLGDGMADHPVPELGGRTPLQCANAPVIDRLTKSGILGLVKTVPEGMPPGSDTANMAVLGYDPKVYYSGRSPFEAASLCVPMKDTDTIFRCNLVTLSEEDNYNDRLVLDHSADEISSEESHVLIEEINRHFGSEVIRFYPGFGYRHVMIWDQGPYDWKMIPPHDILGRPAGEYLPKGSRGEFVADMMKKSADILSEHPINKKRIANGLNPANSIWIWGEGKKPRLSSFKEKYGISGTVVSAVDLIKGLGICAELDTVNVTGATGNIHTNYKGKVDATLDALSKGNDFAYVHIEAPDECGHRYEIENKVKSIELIDREVIEPIIEALDRTGEDYKLMFLPDHPTPLALRTHTNEPVPFMIFQKSRIMDCPEQAYHEEGAQKTGLYIHEGHKLMDFFISGKIQEEKQDE